MLTEPIALPWILALMPGGQGRLIFTLSDGAWKHWWLEASWPPEGDVACPPVLLEKLAEHRPAVLRLQLPRAFDDWPWERELSASVSHAIPRFLVDLPPSTESQGPRALVIVAARDGNMVVPCSPSFPWVQLMAPSDAALVDALDRLLRTSWLGGQTLSSVLPGALSRLRIPAEQCRLYGDGVAPPLALEHGWRPVTALSIDLVKSTRLIIRLGEEGYAQRLQAYHACCRDVVHRLGGSIDRPQGDDGLMAYFGFPVAVEGSAARALQAAWEIVERLRGLGLRVRIGVASGRVVVSSRQAFGRVVHLAARLRAEAEPAQVLVARSTQRRVPDAVNLHPFSRRLHLNDFPRVAWVFQLRGPLSSGATAARHALPFVGRQQELTALQKAWRVSCQEGMQWCMVRGEAGIGKSRLLQEFSDWLREQGQRCIEIVGQPQLASTAYGAILVALRHQLSLLGAANGLALVTALRGWLAQLSADEDELLALVELLRPGGEGDSLNAPGRLIVLLAACMRALLGPTPACLLVDDAHWLDASSAELLRTLGDGSASRPWLVLLGERSEPMSRSSFSCILTIELGGLKEADALALTEASDARMPRRLRQRLVDSADGVPLYLEESLRMVSARQETALGEVPTKLGELLMVRLDGLGPDRALAQLLSVLGRQFEAVDMEALLGTSDPFVDEARRRGSLLALQHAGWIQAVHEGATSYRFRHALMRDAAYQALVGDDLIRLHGHCADVLMRRSGAPPEQLAAHLEAAKRHQDACLAWHRAAKLAAAQQAHEETLVLCRRALSLCRHIDDTDLRAKTTMRLQLLIASARIALLGYGSRMVEAAYLAAERAGRRLADAAQTQRMRLGLESCYVMRGDLSRAAALASDLAAASHWESEPRLALQSRWALANVRFHQGDWRTALQGFDECLAHYQPVWHRPSSVQDSGVMCLGYSSWILFELGRADEALQRIERMLVLASKLDHPYSLGVAHGFAASIKRLCGDSAAAWPHAQEALRTCERGGFLVWLAHAWMVHGQLRSDLGDASAGADDMERGYRLWVGSGARISCATYLATRAEILLRQSQTLRALQELELAWQISEQIGEHYYQSELLRLQGLGQWQLALRNDAPQHLIEADAQLRRALALADAQGKPGLALRCALSLAGLMAASSDHDAALALLQQRLDALPAPHGCRDRRWAEQAIAAWRQKQAIACRPEQPWEPR